VSYCPAMNWLDCDSNNLTSLSAWGDTSITSFHCENNNLTALDVSSNTHIIFLQCYNNHLTSLDLSSNRALTTVGCYNNDLTSLNTSSNKALIDLACEHNSLTSLNVKNGNNHNMNGSHFNATNNPLLTCIQVDNSIYSRSNWKQKDSSASFSNDCHYVGLNEVSVINDVNIYPNPLTTKFTVESNGGRTMSIFVYNIMGEIVHTQNATGSKTTIDISGEASGIYYIRIAAPNERTINKRIVKQ
jgi:hypothetical protein